MQQVAGGNLDAMTLLFERYHKWIYNFFLQKDSNTTLCEDMTQTVFYKAIRYRSSYRGGKFASWIFTIARNVFTDEYRSHKVRTLEIAEERMPEIEDEQNDDLNDERIRLQQVLNTLPEIDREIIVMSRFQGMRYAEIAEVIGSNEIAVKTRMHRIIKKMRTLYFETA